MWVIRWRGNELRPDGSLARVQRSETLGPISLVNRQKARGILQDRVRAINQGLRRPQVPMTFADFVRSECKPNAELALKKSSVRYYTYQFERRIFPSLGSESLCDLSRGQIEECLSHLRQKGVCVLHASRCTRYVFDGPAGRRRARPPRKESGAWHSRSGY
jgi:hypothetical protein